MTDMPDERMERARNASLWASLCRSHGCDRPWVDVDTLYSLGSPPRGLCLRHAADGPVLPLKVRCHTCGDTKRVPWMSEADPNGYQERDSEGMVPCPDCGERFADQRQIDARIVHHVSGGDHPPVKVFLSRPVSIDEQVYRAVQRKGFEVAEPVSAAAIRSESDADRRLREACWPERPEPGRLARLLNARWKWWHGLHGHVSKHRGQASGETFYGCDRGHIARKRR